MKHALWLCTFSSAPALLSHFVMSVLELIAFFPMTYGFFHSFSRTRTKNNLFYRSIKFKENIYDLMECKNNFSFSRIVTTFNKSCEIFHFLFFQRDKKNTSNNNNNVWPYTGEQLAAFKMQKSCRFNRLEFIGWNGNNWNSLWHCHFWKNSFFARKIFRFDINYGREMIIFADSLTSHT